jgi:hypothetical protein
MAIIYTIQKCLTFSHSTVCEIEKIYSSKKKEIILVFEATNCPSPRMLLTLRRRCGITIKNSTKWGCG